MNSITLKDILTAISILIAFVTFVIGYYQNRQSERQKQTLDFLLTINKERGPIHNSTLKMSSWITNGTILKDDNIDSEMDEVVIEVLDFYDLISDSALKRIVDREMIIIHLGGRMRAAYIMVNEYIKARRKRLNRPGLYQPFEEFVTKYICDRDV